jgi:hypothetical protein
VFFLTNLGAVITRAADSDLYAGFALDALS